MSDHCPGLDQKSESATKMEEKELKMRMGRIGRKILVLSGKGGVGKSTIAANLAAGLAMKGKKTGLLDVDLHGPSIPGIFGLKGKRLDADPRGMTLPFKISNNLKVLSIGLLLESPEDPVIWRGPMKYNVIKQLLKDTDWGDIDCLVIDSPPGTGDEPLSVAQLAGENSFALIVTTPQEIAIDDVRRSISFCKKLNLPILGLVENMSGFACPHCGKETDLFGSGGGEKLAAEMDIPFLGRLPIDQNIVISGDHGSAFVEALYKTPSLVAFEKILDTIVNSAFEKNPINSNKKDVKMKIAIPMTDKKLCMHFGHCEEFALIEVDLEKKRITSASYLVPPPHEPGLLPLWLKEQGANLIIAGGMGSRAQSLFAENGIEVMVGVQGDTPDHIVADYLKGNLKTGDNVCDH